ncbi:integration host factor beta subunit [Methylobacter tundripaludum]|jgi:integration host factor subunit beta|uniref:Integration host factor beta subunit n=2 Tax=Methylobacter tundripaludum TaxID=173365 RepID=A0A2S6H6N0_9GAMM|nr:integration host factor beta subunit [Methylobacter tundripaludum]
MNTGLKQIIIGSLQGISRRKTGHMPHKPEQTLNNTETGMTKSKLIDILTKKRPHLERKQVESAVDCMIEHMSAALMSNDRIEIRGFGSFSLHYHPPVTGRNPRTGAELSLPARYSTHFKPGKELRRRVNKVPGCNGEVQPNTTERG